MTALPESGDGQHKVVVKGAGVNAPYDIDLYFYEASCTRTGSAASSAADESGSLPSGTAYVVTQLWSGAATSFGSCSGGHRLTQAVRAAAARPLQTGGYCRAQRRGRG